MELCITNANIYRSNNYIHALAQTGDHAHFAKRHAIKTKMGVVGKLVRNSIIIIISPLS